MLITSILCVLVHVSSALTGVRYIGGRESSGVATYSDVQRESIGGGYVDASRWSAVIGLTSWAVQFSCRCTHRWPAVCRDAVRTISEVGLDYTRDSGLLCLPCV